MDIMGYLSFLRILEQNAGVKTLNIHNSLILQNPVYVQVSNYVFMGLENENCVVV